MNPYEEIPAGRYWGKLQRGPQGEVLAWHPLEAHCADVGAVFEALLRPGALQRKLEEAAGRSLKQGQVQRLAVLATLHDLGKANRGFQNRWDPQSHRTCGHVKPLAGLMAREHLPRIKALLEGLASWFSDPDALMCCLQASFSHHGSPASPFEQPLNVVADQASWWGADGSRDPFQWLEALLKYCREWFPAAFAADAEPLPSTPCLTHLFAGLVSLADWLGSDARWFPFCGQDGRPGPEEDPMPFARRAAAQALAAMGLHQAPEARLNGQPPGFRRQFGLEEPRPLQRAILELPLEPLGDLVVVEGETGSGKTEVAWLHFMRLFCAGLVDGLYFANPLRLAATQIHQRLAAYAANSFGALAPPVVLAVPGYLRADDQVGQRLPGYQVLWPDLGEPELATRFWSAESPKRFLSAPIAAGTVDQALMAGLRLAHAPMRAAALSRSLLVVDEVHASDAYMNRLLHNILELFRSCGGQVLLMSATLGAEAREQFFGLWQGGPRRLLSSPTSDQAAAVPYPLISRPGETHPVIRQGDPPPNGKDVRVMLHAAMTRPEAVAALAAGLARQGAVVLVLRNTVRRAVETFQDLEGQLKDRPDLLFSVQGVPTLHHGRFAAGDRRLLDQRLLSLYGKQTGTPRPRQPGVVVATQTLEQSLDVDFDVLIGDLCPMDVLLQRIGRLQRHGGTWREPAFQDAVCHLLVPEEGEQWLRGGIALGYGFGVDGKGNTRAYADPRALVAAWRLLAGFHSRAAPLRIPAMNRELVEGGLHSTKLEDLAAELGPEWQTDSARLLGLVSHRRQLAVFHGIDWALPYGPQSAGVMDDQKLSTRLGLGDLQVELPAGMPGPFGQAVDTIRIPSWMVRGVHEPTVQNPGALADGGIGFCLGDNQYVYDRLGLRLRGDDK